jgi:hypothetical protein
MDRGYAAMELMRGIISAESSFVLRIRDNSRFEVIEERELSKKATKATLNCCNTTFLVLPMMKTLRTI